VSPRFLLAAGLACATLALGACDKLFTPARTPFNGVDITGGEMGGRLELSDADGKPRSVADFRGKVVIVVFGYTHCPDVCPTTLADMAAAVRQLGERAREVQVLFVTLDPKRDTGDLMRQYVSAFDPSFVGLRGDAQATAKVVKDFHLFAAERPGKTPETYTVDHSAQSFVLDREGRARLLLAPGTSAAAIASDLRALLDA
jgi:protein SCO1/2